MENGCLEGVMHSFQPFIDTGGIVSVPYRIFTASDKENRVKAREEKRKRQTKGDFKLKLKVKIKVVYMSS